jgi:hypothetical protein
MAGESCPHCKGEMDDGHMSVGDTLGYVSGQQQGLLKVTTRVRRARACLECGFIEMYLDPTELRSRLPK